MGGRTTESLKSKTLPFRHLIVKLLAPKIYAANERWNNLVAATPRPFTLMVKSVFHGCEIVGAEIGVLRGDNSLSLLEELPLKCLYLIDPFGKYFDGVAYDNSGLYYETKERLKNYPQVTFLRRTSAEAADLISEPLDFVYVDGNHSYSFVKKDLEIYWSKIRKNGMLGGHDYVKNCVGVVKAVNEFASERKLELITVYPDWWFCKN